MYFTIDENDPTTATNIAFGIIIAIGLIFCFFGYRLFRIIVAVAGFLFLGSIGYTIADACHAVTWVLWMVYIVTGVVGAIIAYTFIKLGAFIIGALSGGALGKFLTDSFLYKISPNHTSTVLWVSIIVLALFGGILAVALMRPAIICLTSWTGSYDVIAGIGYFAGNYGLPSLHDVDSAVDGKNTVPWEWWMYFAATILLALMGAFVQFRYTAYGVHHHHHHSSRKDDTYYRA